MLLSHSLGTDMDLWMPQVPALAREFRVIRYDTRGHGRSSVPDGPYRLADLGADALAVLDACEVQHAHVCGSSLGGLTAMWLAVHAPARVTALVLANTAARIGTSELWSERIRFVLADGVGALAHNIRGRWFTTAFADAHPEVIARFARVLTETSPVGYAGCCAAIAATDLNHVLARIDARTLVIGGVDDPATTPADAERLCAGIRGAQLNLLAAAHLSNVEQPVEFTQAVRRFLNGDSRHG